MKKTRLLALFLAMGLIFALAAGCANDVADGDAPAGGTTDASDGGTADAPVADDDGRLYTESGIDITDHVTIVYMYTGEPRDNGATEQIIEELNKILGEKVNASLDIYPIGWTDYLANYNLTLAAMDGSVDLIGASTTWLDGWQNAQRGAFLELSEEMLQTYAPITWASIPYELWDLCKVNGDIFLIPEDNYAQWTNHGFTYRLDWSREAGIGEIEKWDDLTEYLKYVKDNDLAPILWDATGTLDGIPGGWLASHTNFVGLNVAPYLWFGTKDDLYTLNTPFLTETDLLIKLAELGREWDEIGVWPTDVLNNTGVDNRQDFRLGLRALEQHHTQTWTGLLKDVPENAPGADVGHFYFGKETGNLVGEVLTHGNIAISAASRNPERALMVFDLLRNDRDCHWLINHGIQGRQYEVTDGAYYVQPDSYVQESDEFGLSWWWGRNDDILLRDAQMNWDRILELYAEYDSIMIPYPYGQFIPDESNIRAQLDNLTDVYNNYFRLIAYGKYPGTASEIVEEFQAALRAAGIEDVTVELQKQFDALYK